MLRLEHIKYQNILSIKHLEIPEQKVTCLIGDSGGGKTTLLKLLVKLISPHEGIITFRGVNIETISSIDYRKKVVFLPQKAYIFQKTIKENLILGLNYHKKPYQDQDLEDVLRLVKLHKALDDDARYLSGGEQQRLALARVLLLEADIYLLDEPSSALDDLSEHVMIDVLIDFIKTHHKTLVMVTHNLALAKKYADQIIYFDHINERALTI